MSNDRCRNCPRVLVIAGIGAFIICALAQMEVIPNGGGKVQAGSLFFGLTLLLAALGLRAAEGKFGPQ